MEEAKENHNLIRGFILVNHSNSMILPDEFWDSDECSKLSLHVVSRANGQVLLDLLQRLNVGEICISRRVDTSVDDPSMTAAKGEHIHLSQCGCMIITLHIIVYYKKVLQNWKDVQIRTFFKIGQMYR